MEHIIDCPACKNGKIKFDFSNLVTGKSFSCSEPTCNTSVRLPEDSRDPVKSAHEELKKLR